MTYQPLPVSDYQALNLLANIAVAINENLDLIEWAQTNYGRALKVFSGIDAKNPPHDDEYPMVELVPLDDQDSMNAKHHVRRIGLTLGIHDSEETLVGYNGLAIQRGIVRLEELCRWVFAAVSGADLEGGYIDSVVLHRDPEPDFPYFMAGMEIQINKPRWPYLV